MGAQEIESESEMDPVEERFQELKNRPRKEQ